MAQCKKILENMERCPNRAVPGSEYCKEHQGSGKRKRIKFRKLPPVETAAAGVDEKPSESPGATGPGAERKPSESPATASPGPQRKPSESPATASPGAQRKPSESPESSCAPSPGWTARPFTGGAPSFPGIRLDGRNILAGRTGAILLTEAGVENHVGGIFQRLVRLLSFVSSEVSLAGHVSVRREGDPNDPGSPGDILVFVDAPDPDAQNVSRHFDMLSSAAEFGEGFLFVGADRLFIRYRDENAVSGYDAPDVAPPEGDDIFLVDVEGTRTFFSKQAEDWPLDDLLLRIPPAAEKISAPPSAAFVLAAPALFPMFCRYFAEHEFRFGAARFRGADGKALVLFEVRSRPGSPLGSPVPLFVMKYLDSTPGCVVLTEEEHGNGGARVLSQWRYATAVGGAEKVFDPDCILIFSDGPDFSNLRVSPAPAFFDADASLSASTPPSAYAALSPSDEPRAALPNIPVRLTRDRGPSPFASALILDNEQTGWLLRLVKKLPDNLFYRYSLCRGRDLSVLMADGDRIEGVPFGEPMRGVEGPRLFIPTGYKITPNLPWELLSQVMSVQEGMVAFVTPRMRLDIPSDAFRPLRRALAAEPQRPVAQFAMVPSPAFPELKWTAPPSPKPERKGILRKIAERAVPVANGGKDAGADASAGAGPLEQRAKSCRDQGDFLSAGVCFSLLDDDLNAARCFKDAIAERTGRAANATNAEKAANAERKGGAA